MTQEWVEEKVRPYKKKHVQYYDTIVDSVNKSNVYGCHKEMIREIILCLDRFRKDTEDIKARYLLERMFNTQYMYHVLKADGKIPRDYDREFTDIAAGISKGNGSMDFVERLVKGETGILQIDELHSLSILPIEEYFNTCFSIRYFERLADSRPMQFDGDIIITDPSYLMREDNNEYMKGCPKEEDFRTEKGRTDIRTYQIETSEYLAARSKYLKEAKDDWEMCEYGKKMDVLGIKKYMTRDTIYGDWSCTVYDTSHIHSLNNVIGEFCADAGLVTVADLDHVLAYNPEISKISPSCATIIHDFYGTVQFVVEEINEGSDYEVSIKGKGINKKTGRDFYFESWQTGA